MIVKSIFEGECSKCPEPIHVGDSVSWEPGQNLVSHAVCPDPNLKHIKEVIGRNPNLLAFSIVEPVYNELGELSDEEVEVGNIYALSRENANKLLSRRISQGHHMKAARLKRVL